MLDIDRIYRADLDATPRFDADRESRLARTMVALRRVSWTLLLDSAHADAVVDIVLRDGHDAEVLACARAVRAGTATMDTLQTAIDRVGDEHAVAEAILALAGETSPLWHAVARRSRDAFLAARSRFVSANLRLVVAFARRCGGDALPLADRIQEGNVGLMRAVDRFDPERGVRFSTYAAWWIRHAIFGAQANETHTVRVPIQLQALYARAERLRARLLIELGREPLLRELAITLDCDPERLSAAYAARRLREMERVRMTDGEMADTGVESVVDRRALGELEHAIERRDEVRALEALDGLSARERDIVRRRFDLDGRDEETLTSIGERHGISRERTRQIQRVALDRLRATLEPRAALVPYRAPASVQASLG